MERTRVVMLMAIGVLVLAAVPLVAQAMSHGNERDLPPADGKALYTYITETQPYQEWKLWPGTTEFYKGTQPHGALLSTYVNPTAFRAFQYWRGELPGDSIVVKENYTPDKELAAVTLMYKKKGYAPEAGDYFWLKYAPDGTIQAEGKVQSCIGCHRTAKGGDWLFTND